MIAILATSPLFLLVPASLPQQEVLTPHRVAELEHVSSSRVSPDGRLVAYTRSVPRGLDEDDGAAWNELHVLDVDTGRERAFVTGEVNVGSLDWAPDGSAITFLSRRHGDEKTALWAIPVDGGEAYRVAKLDESIQGYSLAPDGSRAALIAREKKSPERKKREKQGFRQEIYEEDWRAAHVWVAALGDLDAEPRRLEVEGSALSVAWSPAGGHLAVVVSPTPLVDHTYMRRSVQVLQVETGSPVAHHRRPGKLGQVVWSPDGEYLAMIAAADRNDPREGRPILVPALGGETIELLSDLEGHVQAIEWASPEQILCLVHVGLESMIAAVSADEPDRPERIAGPRGPVFRSLSLSADGLTVALLGSSPHHPAELFTLRPDDDQPLRRTETNPWLADVALAEQEPIRYRARDGLELEAVLIHPLERARGQRVPLIVVVHGGPEAHESNGWLTAYQRPGQMAAAQGFAVVYPNYRGSTGRGVAFSKLSQGDPAGKEFDDLVDCVDHLIERGLVDPDRVAVTGGSYGGYATAWCSTRFSERFAAGVMFVGISNNISKVGTSDIPEELFEVHHRVRVWDDYPFFLERSPIYHAANSRTPLLILHGKDDPRVDRGQSLELYRHLQQRGQAPVRLVLYPGEGHGNRKGSSRLDYSLRMMRWFEHYLVGPGGDMPSYEVDYELPEPDEDEADEPIEASAPTGS